VTIEPKAVANYYEPGATVTVTAQPVARMAFSGWSGAQTGSDSQIQFTIDQDMQITATFGPDPNAPIIINGDFSQGNAGWTWYQHESGSGSLATQQQRAVVTIENPGTEIWHAQLLQTDLPVQGGAELKLQFDAMATTQRSVVVTIKHMSGGETKYLDSTVTWLPSMQTFELPFTVNSNPKGSVRLEFNFGTKTGNCEIDNMAIVPQHVSLRSPLAGAGASGGAMTSVWLSYHNSQVIVRGVEPSKPWSLLAHDLQGNVLARVSSQGGQRVASVKLLPTALASQCIIVQFQQGVRSRYQTLQSVWRD